MDLLREAGLSFCGSFTQTSGNTDIITSDAFIDMLVDKGCFALWLFSYVPVGREPDLALMPTPEQRDLLRRADHRFPRREADLFVDFWNDGPSSAAASRGGGNTFTLTPTATSSPASSATSPSTTSAARPLREALKSPLFQRIRERQGEHDNLLRPCMLIDHPEVGRELFGSAGSLCHP